MSRLTYLLLPVIALMGIACSDSPDDPNTPSLQEERIIEDLVDRTLAIKSRVAADDCVCEVRAGFYSSLDACDASLNKFEAEEEDAKPCLRELFLENIDLVDAISCAVDQAEAITDCEYTSDCDIDAYVECLEQIETDIPCPPLPDVFSDASDACFDLDTKTLVHLYQESLSAAIAAACACEPTPALLERCLEADSGVDINCIEAFIENNTNGVELIECQIERLDDDAALLSESECCDPNDRVCQEEFQLGQRSCAVDEIELDFQFAECLGSVIVRPTLPDIDDPPDPIRCTPSEAAVLAGSPEDPLFVSQDPDNGDFFVIVNMTTLDGIARIVDANPQDPEIPTATKLIRELRAADGGPRDECVSEQVIAIRVAGNASTPDLTAVEITIDSMLPYLADLANVAEQLKKVYIETFAKEIMCLVVPELVSGLVPNGLLGALAGTAVTCSFGCCE